MGFTLRAATALATTILFLVPGAVQAQSQIDWSGPYAGVTLGVVRTNSNDVDIVNSGGSSYASGTVSGTGLIGGLTLGNNWDLGDLVVGIEADGSFTTLEGSASGSSPSFDFDSRLNALLTLRGRLGVEVGNALIYGTAGVAAAVTDNSLVANAGSGSSDGTTLGAVAGAGAEFAVNDNLSIKTEGLMFQTGSINTVADNGKDGSYAPGGVALRAGVNYRF